MAGTSGRSVRRQKPKEGALGVWERVMMALEDARGESRLERGAASCIKIRVAASYIRLSLLMLGGQSSFID
jgi:hypothetical protein